MEEVINIVGGEGKTEISPMGDYNLLRYFDYGLYNIPSAQMIYVFREDKMFCKMYAIEENQYDFLTEQLTSEYGESIDDIDATIECMKILGANLEPTDLLIYASTEYFNFKSWKDDKNEIILINAKTGDGEGTFLFYLQSKE